METLDKPIEEMRQCLEKAQNLAPVKQQLDSNMSQGKSDPSEILPMLGEMKGYLEELESINNKIDRVMKQIEERLEMQDYELTQKEMVKVKRLLMNVEAISQEAKIYVEAAEKGPESLPSEIESHRREQDVNERKIFQAAALGAGAGALVLGAAFLPVVGPAVAPAAAVCGGGALGGGAIGGVDKFLSERHGNYVEYKILIKERRKLESRLNTLKTGLAVKQLRIDNVKKKIEGEVRITGEVRGEI